LAETLPSFGGGVTAHLISNAGMCVLS